MAVSLADARNQLTSRLAEESMVFWDTATRTQALNDAQRLIAVVTRGVPEEVSGTVGGAVRSLSFTGKPVAPDAANGMVTGVAVGGAVVGRAIVGVARVGISGARTTSRALVAVSRAVADVLFPHWWGAGGPQPRWMVIDEKDKLVYFVPVPDASSEVSLEVRVQPELVMSDSDLLFNGVDYMDKYLQAAINYAAAMLLLRERFDGDAERFYQFAMAELTQLGHSPGDVPPLPVGGAA